MKLLCVAFVFLLLAVGLSAPTVEARARDDGDNDDVELLTLFRVPLAPYGDWIHFNRYGWSWSPRHVAPGWRPYSVGHWVLTDYGWTWVSDEPWGWATAHYGRWFFDRSHGWLWVPGPIWGPAWVAWRTGGGIVGWAPLPPGTEASRPDLGLAFDPSAFCFVEERDLLEPALLGHILPREDNAGLVGRTTNVTRYVVVDERFEDLGVDPAEVERVSGHAVTRLRVRDVPTIDEARRATASGSRELAVYRPAAGGPHL